MAGREISENSKNLIKLIRKGKSRGYLLAKGYKKETIKYYRRKMERPEAYRTFLKNIARYNANSAKKLSTVL